MMIKIIIIMISNILVLHIEMNNIKAANLDKQNYNNIISIKMILMMIMKKKKNNWMTKKVNKTFY